jgi:methylphosphotriester-DNA--protein-cysteine methyltransferase
LARVFKRDMGMSLVEYRNRLRLDRFWILVDGGRPSLLEAALAAGFGSYAQFHRVFRAQRQVTPREYLRRRRSLGSSFAAQELSSLAAPGDPALDGTRDVDVTPAPERVTPFQEPQQPVVRPVTPISIH